MINSRLLMSLSKEDKTRMVDAHSHLQFVFKKVSEILEDDYKKCEDNSVKSPDVVENWALQQAYIKGQQAAYKRLIDLLNSKET